MKKREITNNDLEQLFAKITKQAPLISEEQVDVLLTNYAAATPGNRMMRFFQSHLNSLLLGAVFLIAASVFIWTNTGKVAETTIAQNLVQENPPIVPLTGTLVLEPQFDSTETKKEQAELKDSVHIQPIKPAIVDSLAAAPATISLKAIYQQAEKKPQVFFVSANKDTTITCNEGTTIKIAANSFVSEKTGEPVTGKVKIAVKEYYQLSDIILANLTTTSDGKILETGGMLYVTANSAGKKCTIKAGQSVEIGFPNTNRKDGMALFYGEQDEDKIDWKLAETSKPENRETFFIVESMPEFPGGQFALNRFIYANLRYPVDAMQKGIQAKVFVNFVIDEEGNVCDASVTRSVDPLLDKEALRVVNSFPKWSPGMQRGKPVRVSYTIPIGFNLNGQELVKPNEKFEQTVEGDDFRNVTASDVNRYIFNTTQLGWLNCDRFYSSTRTTTEYAIPFGKADEITVNLVFHRFRAVIPGIIAPDRAVFNRVSLGEKVTIIAVKTVGSQLLLAAKETEITHDRELELNFQPVTIDRLKLEIEKLNKRND